MQRVVDLPGGAYFDGSQTLAPLALIKAYEKNPRDPRDFDFALSADFRALVYSVEKVGVTNPVQVFWQDGAFQLIAGHRRRAAVIEINRQRQDAWEQGGRQGKPDLIEYLPASIQKAPTSEYERHVAMWNAEETKAEWPESRKFNFFCATYDAAPPDLRANVAELAKELGMKQSTVRTYLELRSIPELSKAMADPSELRMPRNGRHKTLRAMARLIDETIEKRPSVVRVVTQLKPTDERAKDVLAARLFSKYQVYAQNPRLGVGPGVALERTVPLIDPSHDCDISDAELTAWFGDQSVLREETIERRQIQQPDGNDGSDDSVFDRVKRLGLRQRPGRLETDELQTYVDDLNRAADYLAEEARKARQALQHKLSR